MARLSIASNLSLYDIRLTTFLSSPNTPSRMQKISVRSVRLVTNALILTGDADELVLGIKGYLYVGPGTIVMILAEGTYRCCFVRACQAPLMALSSAIMMLRIYAIYERDVNVLCFLYLLALGSVGYSTIQAIGVTSKALQALHERAQQLLTTF